jgi:hypothetical protein
MTPVPDPVPGTLEQRRERTIQALCRHVAADALTIEEFERRVDIAHRAATAGELDMLLQDLPAIPGPAAPAATSASPAPAAAPRDDGRRDHQIVAAILGGAERKGAWVPARRISVFAVMGGSILDFRDARIGPGVTEISVFTFWGGIEIIVPPGITVESGGTAIMGGFEHNDETGVPANPDAPTLRINGVAIMGGVSIKVRYPGETLADDRHRRRLEQRAGHALPR